MYPSSDGWAQVGEPQSSNIKDFHSDYLHFEKEEALLNFPPFSRLPNETSSAIWKYALQSHRLINITVTDKDRDGPAPWSRARLQYTGKNGRGNIISGRNYKLSVTTSHRLHPILQVSRESRQAALQFYRVHIPCDFNTNGERQCLYLNPEFDFILLRTKGVPEILADFVHDARAYDPQGIGILNMGIGEGKPEKLSLPMDPSSLLPPALSALSATLINLQRVFFHEAVYTDTRHMFSSLELAEVRFNRSIPIDSSTEAFDLVATDPRPIDADLDKVSLGWDPRAMLCLWQQMERNFQIRREGRPVEFQFLITAPTHGEAEPMRIISRADAGKFLQFEKDLWRSDWEDGSVYKQWKRVNPDTPEKVKKAPIPVIGFWVFPVDAFGDVPEGDFEDIRWGIKEVVDLTKRRPGLGVFRLPQED